jgi:hypothetical protein
MLADGGLDSMANPQNAKRKVYRVVETSAEKSWTRNQAIKTKGSSSYSSPLGRRWLLFDVPTASHV